MCSVIEIKNNDEYYIRYHSPDSMVENSIIDKKEKQPKNPPSRKQEAPHSGSDDGTNTTSGDSGHQRDILSNSPKSQIEDQLVNEFSNTRSKDRASSFDISKDRSTHRDADVTSDRGSSEESIIDGKQKINDRVLDLDSAELVSSKRKTGYRSNNNRGASIEKVPITINSHIPASPERLLSQKTATHDTGTQIETPEGKSDDSSSPVKSRKRPSNNVLTKSGPNKHVDQDNAKDNKPSENLVQPRDENTDKNQEIRTAETNLRNQLQQVDIMKNGTQEMQRNSCTDLRNLPGTTQSICKTGEFQHMSNAQEGFNKKSFLCRSSTNNQIKGASFLPVQLEEKVGKNSSPISKKSSIPILIKKEVSPRRKLSSLISSSKCTTDRKDKSIKKEQKKGKSNNSGVILTENTNKEKTSSRKESIKINASEKKKKDSNEKGGGEFIKISKISPIIALSNQCKNGFGKRKNKSVDRNNMTNIPTENDSRNKYGEMKDKMIVKKSYSMDSIGDIYKSIPQNEPGLRKDKIQEVHYSQNQIDVEKSFFDQHPHAVLKAAKTKDGYTVYGSGKKWTIGTGK